MVPQKTRGLARRLFAPKREKCRLKRFLREDSRQVQVRYETCLKAKAGGIWEWTMPAFGAISPQYPGALQPPTLSRFSFSTRARTAADGPLSPSHFLPLPQWHHRR